MDLPRQPKHISACAFVGTFGKGTTRQSEIRAVCDRSTRSFQLGAAHVTFVGRNNETFDLEKTVTSVVLHTGRPFLEDRLFTEGMPPDADKLDGKFAVLTLKPKSLELLTDCLGAGSIYYSSQGGLLYFSSHLGLLLKALPQVPEPNELGIASQLFSREQVLDETHFSGVYRLPAGGRLTADLNAGEKVDVRMIRGDGIKGLLDIDAPEFGVDSFRALLDVGVERERYDANSVLMLSGGRDSIAIALARTPVPSRAVTYGETYSLDFLRGKRRARRFGFEFLAVPYQNWTLNTYRDEIVGLNAGCTGLDEAHNMIGFDWASDKTDLAAIGYLGDTYRGKILYDMEREGDELSVRPLLLKRYNNPMLHDVFPKEGRILGEFVMDTFRDLARDVGARRALVILKIQWMQARWLSTVYDLCDWFVPTSYPFMQRKLIGSWLQTDMKDVRNRKVFGLALEQGLAERGFNKDFRGGVLERLWNRSFATVHARCRGRYTIGRTDWYATVERSQFRPEDFVCSHPRITEVTQRAWQGLLSGADPKPDFQVLYSSAAIAATLNQLSPS